MNRLYSALLLVALALSAYNAYQIHALNLDHEDVGHQLDTTADYLGEIRAKLGLNQ